MFCAFSIPVFLLNRVFHIANLAHFLQDVLAHHRLVTSQGREVDTQRGGFCEDISPLGWGKCLLALRCGVFSDAVAAGLATFAMEVAGGGNAADKEWGNGEMLCL